jgi:membrane associated rhomboid family serine protease
MRARVTQGFLLINILLFILFNLILGFQYVLLLTEDNRLIIENYEYWRLITAMFVHADGYHLLNNMVFLLVFGVACEEFYTKRLCFMIYFVSGLIGNIFSLLLTPIDTIGLGASGAILGLVGAAFIKFAKTNKFILVIGTIYIIQIIYNSFAPGIGTWAHIFGLASGALIGFWQQKRENAKVSGIKY